MSRSLRILAAVLVLAALGPTTFGAQNLVCVEASGRTSYGCNDLVPDEVSARLALPVTLGACLQDCGFCHDYIVGQAVTQSVHTLALPVVLTRMPRLLLPQRASLLQSQPFPVVFLDSSGSVSPLKC
jgi:hypothetical protein